jgi:hypothetical protein
MVKESSTGKIIKPTFRLNLYLITPTIPSLIPMELNESMSFYPALLNNLKTVDSKEIILVFPDSVRVD